MHALIFFFFFFERVNEVLRERYYFVVSAITFTKRYYDKFQKCFNGPRDRNDFHSGRAFSVFFFFPTHLQIRDVRRKRLSFGRHPRPYESRPDRGAYQMRLFSHVAHAEHETQLPVPATYHRVSAEHERLAALFGPGHFREHDAHHERLRATNDACNSDRTKSASRMSNDERRAFCIRKFQNVEINYYAA